MSASKLGLHLARYNISVTKPAFVSSNRNRLSLVATLHSRYNFPALTFRAPHSSRYGETLYLWSLENTIRSIVKISRVCGLMSWGQWVLHDQWVGKLEVGLRKLETAQIRPLLCTHWLFLYVPADLPPVIWNPWYRNNIDVQRKTWTGMLLGTWELCYLKNQTLSAYQ